MNENAETLLKDPSCQKSREHFLSAMRVLELVQIGEIEMLLDTITGVCILYTEVLVENPNIHCIPCLFVLSVSTCEM